MKRRLRSSGGGPCPESDIRGQVPGITNAGTEATNRTVKTAARTAYGFRNLDNQRRRVRFACTRRHRRAIAC